MLVRALRLRHQGVKLDPAVLRATVPLEGLLRLNPSRYQGGDGRGRTVCLLMPPDGSLGPIVEMFSAKLVRIEARGILISGEEDEWNRKRRNTFRQTLWAWPVPPPLSEKLPDTGTQSREMMKLLEAIEALGVGAD